MVQQKMTSILHGLFQSSYQEIKQFKYAKELLIFLVFIGGAGSIFLLYKTYARYRERSAQNMFAQYVQKFYSLQDDKSVDLQELAILFQRGSQQQKNTSLAPYFLLFQAEILSKENKKKEALLVMNELVNEAVDSPLLPLFKTKRALIKLDEPDKTIQQSGLEELKELVKNEKNKFRDTAQFYLGLYYWDNNLIDQAQKIWQKLVNDQYKEKLAPSPWVNLVKQKLEYTITTESSND